MDRLLLGIVAGVFLLGIFIYYYLKGRHHVLDEMLKKGDISEEIYKRYL